MEFTEIEFIDIDENEEYVNIINEIVEECFKTENLKQKNLYINIILTNSKEIRKTNKKYRNIDKSTDVLSFPMFEKEEINNIILNGNEVYDVLGDIIISIEQVEVQAKEYGHSFCRELSYMIVHGFYHLMGYDHMEEDDKKEMRIKEDYILNKLKITRE